MTTGCGAHLIDIMKSTESSRAIPFKKIDEEDLIDALRIQGVDKYTYQDLHKFLIGTSNLKNIAERWLCWMIKIFQKKACLML